MIWSTDYLNRLVLEAETEIAKQIPCIIDRYSLPIEGFIDEYTLPDYITNIRRVIWKGTRLDPVSGAVRSTWPVTILALQETTINEAPFNSNTFDDEENTFFTENNVTYFGGSFGNFEYGSEFEINVNTITYGMSAGTPTHYFYSGFGENVIKFHRPPSESVQFYSNNLFDTNIPNAVIIEYYRMPDGSSFTTPSYIRRRTIKPYVLWKAFAKEGSGQNLNAANYWEKRYLIALERARSILNNIYRASSTTRSDVERKMVNREWLRKRGPLPSNYGIVVGDYD